MAKPKRFLAYGPYRRGAELSTPRGVFAVAARTVMVVDTEAASNVVQRFPVPDDFPDNRLTDGPGVAVIPLSPTTAERDTDDEIRSWWAGVRKSLEDDAAVRPARSAAKKKWVAFRVSQGYTENELEGLNRDALIALTDPEGG